MKQLLLIVYVLLGSLAVQAQGFDVNNYEVEVFINEEGYFDVVERYNLNFTQYKHGIFRDILTHYDLLTAEGNSERRKIRIEEIKVPGHNWTASTAFAQKFEGKVQIKIGDADKTIIGEQYYEIRYRVYNAFLYEEDATRFYWNLKPIDWWATFNNVSFKIHFPEASEVTMEKSFIYSGPIGFTDLSESFNLQFSDNVLSGESLPGRTFPYGHAVTSLVELKSGSIKEIKPFWPFWTNYGWTLILGVFGLLFYWLWKVHGKDDHVTTTTSYYPPEGIDPAMAGFLINDKEDTSDLTALIPFWGHKGLLKMEVLEGKNWFKKDDTRITRLNGLPSGSPSYETSLFNNLFKAGNGKQVLVSELKDKFYTDMTSAKAKLKKAAQQYYTPKSRAVRKIVWGLLVLLLVATVPVFLFFWGVIAVIAGAIGIIFLMIINRYMIKKNTHGNRVFTELKGFREFIRTAEKNKLKMLLGESPIYFESTMGYAMAFGEFKDWARKFDDLNVKPPDWYSSSNNSFHNMHGFSNSFSSTMSSTSSTMVSSPSSSGSGSGGGGGFSGGGFGGGGGGSW